jgi:hypothetical protein
VVNRLTINADTKPWEFTKEQALLAARGGYAFAKVESESVLLAQLDQNETYDKDPNPGVVYTESGSGNVMTAAMVTFDENYGEIIDPGDIKDYVSGTVDAGTGSAKLESLRNEMMFDADGDGQREKGTLVSVFTYSDVTAPPDSRLDVFANFNNKSLTIIEERA